MYLRLNSTLSFKEIGDVLGKTETWARVKGYVSGFAKASIRYIPNFALGAVAIFVGKKHPKIANLAALGLGIVEAIDFAMNALKTNQRDDYLS